MEFVVMTVGKTHSGKTTFGIELAKKLKNACILDFDMLVEFFKTAYPWLYDCKNFKTTKDENESHYLSLKVRNLILKQSFKTSLPIVFTNVNSLKILRSAACKLAHKYGKRVIMVYFNRPEKILLDRIKNSNRSKICLTRSKDFTDLLLNRQSKVFEPPTSKEADLFFEIKDEQSLKETKSKILKLIKN